VECFRQLAKKTVGCTFDYFTAGCKLALSIFFMDTQLTTPSKTTHDQMTAQIKSYMELNITQGRIYGANEQIFLFF
jgi:hypothetical protein